MKKMKRLAAFLLAMVMVLAMSMPAMAATININSGVDKQEYKAYKIFDVVKSEGDSPSYAYTIKSDSKWYNTVDAYANTDGKGMTLTKIEGTTNPEIYNVTVTTTFSADDFAKTLNNVDTTSFTEAGKIDSYSDTNKAITVTDPGYYFVDSSMGALCILNTAVDTIDVTEKNAKPDITKKVKEDSKPAGSEWVETATADIGQTIEYKLTVNVGTEVATGLGTGIDKDFVIIDTLPTGINVDVNTVSINGWEKNTDYTVTLSEKNLTITLKNDKLKTLSSAGTVEITYSGTLTENATINGDNQNGVKLTYGTYETTEKQANVKTFDIEVFKFTYATAKNPLSGAEFTLTRKNDNTVFCFTTGTNNIYTVAPQNTAGASSEITTDTTGKFKIQGLDADIYLLTETKAPEGYTQLEKPIEVTIAEDGTATYLLPNETTSVNEDTNNGGILIENKAGSILPSTGGMGTTIFYIVGGILVVGAGVLLVTRKRMDGQKK